MNTNPNAIKILCFGDSNTYGQNPDKINRYPADVRWTGLLQSSLGQEFYVIEEGLGGRTTDLDYVKPGRNGKEYFTPCLVTHNPIDIVIIMLGTNDLKMQYARTAEDIAKALAGLVEDVRTYANNSKKANPKIILISPTIINDQAPNFAKFYTGYYDNNSAQESRRLADVIKAVADRNDCIFLNAADVAEPGEDGIHLREDSNKPLATLVEDKIRAVINEH